MQVCQVSSSSNYEYGLAAKPRESYSKGATASCGGPASSAVQEKAGWTTLAVKMRESS